MKEFHCNKFKFIQMEHVGTLPFNEKRQSVGWDEVCSHIDAQKAEIDMRMECGNRLYEKNKILKSFLHLFLTDTAVDNILHGGKTILTNDDYR